MQAIQQRYYVPNNTAIIVTGDVAPDRAFTLARTVFGGWARGADPFATDTDSADAAAARSRLGGDRRAADRAASS